jgi:hypothetical protein
MTIEKFKIYNHQVLFGVGKNYLNNERYLLHYLFIKWVIKNLSLSIKALRQIYSTTLLLLNLGTRWRLVVNIMPQNWFG